MPTPRLLLGCLLAAAVVVPQGNGQNRVLEIVGTTPVAEEQVNDFVVPVKADATGNLYLRYGLSTNAARPIVKISPTGLKLATYDISALPVWWRSLIRDFCIDDGGNLIALVTKPDHTSHILTFDASGQLQSNFEISSAIDPFEVAIAGNGKVLLSGRVNNQGKVSSNQALDSRPMIVMVNSKGDTDVVPVTGDITPPPRPAVSTAPPRRDHNYEYALAGSLLTTSSDGNIYLARRGNSGIIFKIGPNGIVEQRFKVQIPVDYSLEDIKVSGQKIAALLALNSKDERNRTLQAEILIVDATDGTVAATYALTPGIPLTLARFEGDSAFTFVGSAPTNATLTIYAVGPK